ncbi:MAG TPA: cobalamin-independent methionine synthase II family protein [Chloroflexota bacterium]|nr:cobalamin-independent methionine synthase II family protein [Chloroflexota bacterium]
MRHSTSRVLTTHVGSLVRPLEVMEFMKAIEKGLVIDEQTFAGVLRSAVAEVVRRQAEIGIDVVSDGEYGKRGWSQYVTERLTGFERRECMPGERPTPVFAPLDRRRFAGFYEIYDRLEKCLWLPQTDWITASMTPEHPVDWICTGPVRYRGEAAVRRDIANFKAALAEVRVEEAFMPVVAPCSAEAVRANAYYPTQEDYLFAIAEALKVEYRIIIEAGFVLQVDDAFLPMQYTRMAEMEGVEAYRKWAQVRIDALNYALDGIPPEHVRYHVCWGSQNVPHTSDVPLRAIVDLILQVNAGAYSIEAANPRHEHEWQVWEDVRLPAGKILIPGVVSHATNVVEHPELVAWRLKNFARLVGRERIIAGTDCGFSQNWNLIRVHHTIQWAKLESLVEGARLASKQLWS